MDISDHFLPDTALIKCNHLKKQSFSSRYCLNKMQSFKKQSFSSRYCAKKMQSFKKVFFELMILYLQPGHKRPLSCHCTHSWHLPSFSEVHTDFFYFAILLKPFVELSSSVTFWDPANIHNLTLLLQGQESSSTNSKWG